MADERIIVYVERSGAGWVAMFYRDRNDKAYYGHQDREEAITAAVTATGYRREQCRIVAIGENGKPIGEYRSSDRTSKGYIRADESGR